MRGIITVLLIAALALGGYVATVLVPASGAFTELEPLLVDQCQSIDIAPGTEDVTIDPATGIAFVSSADRRNALAGNPADGGIYAFHLDDPQTVWKVSPENMGDFLPHGISLWGGANGAQWRGDGSAKRLFVVNHPAAGGHQIEIFSVGGNGSLTHLETVSFDAMHSPNDVLAVGPRMFYATNDRGYRDGFMSSVEAYLALPLSSVAYFDGTQGAQILKGLTYANGINISADGETIYISEFLKRRVGSYKRNALTGELTSLEYFPVDTGPDNIEIGPSGELWIAGHSKVFEFLAHAKDEAADAPSYVFRLDPDSGEIDPIFTDTSGAINAASVGAAWNDTLVVGAVFDRNVMVCPLGEAG